MSSDTDGNICCLKKTQVDSIYSLLVSILNISVKSSLSLRLSQYDKVCFTCAKTLTVCQLNLPHGTKQKKQKKVMKKLKTKNR